MRVRYQQVNAGATKDGRLTLLALDWAKVFDSISPDAMQAALRLCGKKLLVESILDILFQTLNGQVRLLTQTTN